MAIKAKWIIIFGLLLLFSKPAISSVSATTSHNPGMPALLQVVITDNITKEDAAVIIRKASEMSKKYGGNWKILARLNSSGGSVSASLQIGRILRKVGAMAVVDKGSVCMSSCVYVLAGAANRAVDGLIGIHRPYDPDGKELSESAQKTMYKKLGADIKAYLAVMNIPTRLYDDALFISPENVKILSPNEMQAYGLNENDPYADEADATRAAQKLGVSRKEYASRNAKARQKCLWDGSDSTDSMMQLMDCRDAIIEGKD